MKIKELISLLQRHDPEMMVVVDGYESGYDEVERVNIVNIINNPKALEKTWEGEYNEDYLNDKGTKALLLPRKS
jgi:hypothetical protein